MGKIFFMRNLFMKFQNHNFFFEWTHVRRDGRTHGQAQSNMPLNCLKVGGHKNPICTFINRPDGIRKPLHKGTEQPRHQLTVDSLYCPHE